MATPAALLEILVTANNGQATAALAQTQKQLKTTAATATATGATIRSRLATGAKYGALALAGIGAASVKMAIDFDRSMRNVNSIAQLNERQFAKLEDRVKGLAGRTAQSPQTLAEGLYDLVSSGFDANESMKVLASSAKAATAGLTDTKTSTKAVAAVLNAYRMPAKKAADVSDTLFQTVNVGVVSFDELASTIGDVLPFASSLGVKLDEVGAATATMTKAGISPAETMTRLKAIMSSLIKPSEDMTATLKQMGYESGEALIKQEGLQGALDALAKSTGGSKQAMAALFPNIRALGGALALTGDNSKLANKDLAAFADTSGATAKALAEQSKSVAYQWDKLKAQGHALAIDVGDNLIPALRDMLKILTNPKLTLSEKVAKLGTELTKTIEEWGPKVAKAGAAIGLAIIKGIWGAFWDSDLLGKLFIGAAALRLFGGPGVFSSLGGTIATKIGGGMKARFGAIGPGIMAAILVAGIQGLQEKNLTKEWADVIEKNLPMLRLQRDALTGTEQYLAEQLSMWKAMGHKINERVIWTWMENGKISAAGAARLIKILKPLQQKWQQAFTDLADTTKKTGGDIRTFTGKTADWMRAWASKGGDAIDKLSNALRDPFQKSLDKTKDKVKSFTESATDKLKDFANDAGKAFDKTSDKSKTMQQKVGANIMNLSRTVTSGLEIIVGNTNKALKGFGVKKVAITLNNVGDAAKGFQRGGVVGAQKGAVVGGSGSGDKVPLHIGGRLSAMVEPGELVSVTNRTATAAQMALNRKIPRRRDGGLVPHLAKGGMAAMVALANRFDRASEPYSMGGGHGSFLTSPAPVDCSGAVSAILHAGGLLQGAPMDTIALAGWGRRASGNESLVVATRPLAGASGHTVMKINGRVFGTSGEEPGGGAGWLSSSNPRDYVSGAVLRTMPIAGAAAQIARVLLKGPDGPLKDLGQKALDKTRSAANRFLAAQMPKGVAGGGDWGPVGKMKRYTASEYGPPATGTTGAGGYLPGHNSFAELSNDWQNGIYADFSALGGLPMHSLLRVAYRGKSLVAEKRDVGAGGPGIGGTKRAIDFYADTASKLGFSGLDIVEAAPISRQHGGLVPHLAKGGKPGKGEVKPGPVDRAYKRFAKARQIADKLKALAGEKGRIARLDERIQIAETMAGLDSSELGSDLGPHERHKQIRLNEALLSQMVMARKLARSGLGWLTFPKGMSTAAIKPGQLRNLRGRFSQTLLDLTGLTGHSGRIFDTRMQLNALKHATTGTGAEAMDISGLRSVIEAARYGAFDGYFATGGTIGRGKWGVVGERGPEIVRGPATVTPSPEVRVENNFDFEGMDLIVTTTVNGELAKRQKLSHRQARQYVR